MFELTVSLGSVLTIASFLVGGVVFVLAIKSDTKVQETKFTLVAEQLGEVKLELKKLSEVLITLAIQDGKIKGMGEQLMLQGIRLDDTTRRLNTFIDANIFTRMKAYEDQERERRGQS